MTRHRPNFPTGVSILVADADEGSAKALATHLERQGFWVCQTNRGDEAVLLMRLHQPALAVIDIALEEMSGCELATRLKQIDAKLPVVMTAGDRLTESEAEARQVGIVYYAPKPIDLRKLDTVVRKASRDARRRSNQARVAKKEAGGDPR